MLRRGELALKYLFPSSPLLPIFSPIHPHSCSAFQSKDDTNVAVVNVKKDGTVNDLKSIVELRKDPQFVAECFHVWNFHWASATCGIETVLKGGLSSGEGYDKKQITSYSDG